MKLTTIRLIASKELQDILSEKVYWLAFLLELIIVLGVILLGIAFAAIVNPVEMAANSPDLGIRLGFLDENGAVPEDRFVSCLRAERVSLVEVSNRSEMMGGILDGSLIGGIVIPEGYDEAEMKTLEIDLLLDPAKPLSSIAQAKVERAVESANEDLAMVRRHDLGLHGEVGLSMERSYVGEPATPIDSPDFVEAMYLMVIPLVLIFPMLLAANMMSDSVVGEKETGTLGILMSAPISKLEMVLGKVIPVLSLANLQFVLWIALLEYNVMGSVSVFNKLPLLVILNLGGLCFTGGALLISTRARSTKESNLYLTLLIICCMVPLFAGYDGAGVLGTALESILLVRIIGMIAASPSLPASLFVESCIGLGILVLAVLWSCARSLGRLELPPSR